MKDILRQPSAHVKKQFFLFPLLLFAVAAFFPSFSNTANAADYWPFSKVMVQVKGTSRNTLTGNVANSVLMSMLIMLFLVLVMIIATVVILIAVYQTRL